LNSKGFIPLLVDSCPGPPGAFTNGISVSHSKSILYGSFVWARRTLNRPKWRFLARAVVFTRRFERLTVDVDCTNRRSKYTWRA